MAPNGPGRALPRRWSARPLRPASSSAAARPVRTLSPPHGQPFTGRRFTNDEVYLSGCQQNELRRGQEKAERTVDVDGNGVRSLSWIIVGRCLANQPLRPVRVMPRMIWRWKRANTISTGIVAMLAPVIGRR